MKQIRRLVLMVLCIAVISAATSGSLIATDSPSPWAAEQVNAAISKSLVPPDLQSDYTQAISRAEFSALIVTFYENIRGEITERVFFVDTDDENVQKAAYIGVVTGIGDNNFDPDSKLTREQAAVMLSRLSDAIERPFPIQTAGFADYADIAFWSIESVGRVQAAGIMGGVGDNRFAPQDPYTREQSIVTIMRLFDALIIEQEYILEDEYEYISKSEEGYTFDTDGIIYSNGAAVGIIYSNPAFRAVFVINNTEWIFYTNTETGTAYFFNYVNQCQSSLISMSVIEFSGSASRAMEQHWNTMRTMFISSPNVDFEYIDSIAIDVGYNYSGYLHKFKLHHGNTTYISNVAVWTADNLLYRVVATANTQTAEEVEAVLNGLFESFINLGFLSPLSRL